MMARPPVFVGRVGADDVEQTPVPPPRATGNGTAMERTDVGNATLFSTWQPAVDDGVAACFSGFLYNTATPREAGSRILSLYQEKGAAFLDEVDGRFATAIYDSRSDALHLYSDRKGCQTLYYGETDTGVTFGTHLLPLLQLNGVDPPVDRDGAAAYLQSWPVFYSGERTLVENVSRVPPAHRLLWQDGQQVIERYWDVRPDTYRQVSDETAADQLETLLRESITRRLRPDDAEPALLLSGGLDSSLLAAMLTEIYDGDIHTFTAGFTEEQLRPAQDRAASLDTVHTETMLPFSLPGKEDVWRWGTPFIGMLHMPLFRLLDEWGVEQVFSGQSSPAAFPVGLGRLRMMDRFRPLQPLLRPLSRLPVPVHRLPDRALAGWEVLASPHRSSVITNSFTVNRRLTDHLIDDGGRHAVEQEMDQRWQPSHTRMDERFNYLQVYARDAPWMQIANRFTDTLEPYTDTALLEYAHSLPMAQREDRRLQRMIASEYLPQHVVERPPSGAVSVVDNITRRQLDEDWDRYSTAVNRFLERGYLKSCASQVLLPDRLERAGWNQVMFMASVYLLELWLEAFTDREQPWTPP